jgi:hypothetical protein
MEKKIKIGKGHTHIYTIDEKGIIQSSRCELHRPGGSNNDRCSVLDWMQKDGKVFKSSAKY